MEIFCPIFRNVTKKQSLCTQKGFTLLEVLVSMAIVGIIGVLVFSIQASSWKVTTFANRTLVAGHMIDQQIEQMRMDISKNPTMNFPPENGMLVDNGIKLSWAISNATRPTDGSILVNVKKCDLTASWGKTRNDTLKVSSYLSKMF